jgi:hypothetical protein
MEITIRIYITESRSHRPIDCIIRTALPIGTNQITNSHIHSNSLRFPLIYRLLLEMVQPPSVHPIISTNNNENDTSKLEHPGPPFSHITVRGLSAICLFAKCQKNKAPLWSGSTLICLSLTIVRKRSTQHASLHEN